MALQFNPYPYRQEEPSQGSDIASSITSGLSGLSDTFLRAMQMRAEERKNRALMDMAKRKESREASQQAIQNAYEYGTPIDSSAMVTAPAGVAARSMFMPGANRPAGGIGPSMPGQGQVGSEMRLVDAFNKWRSGGMKAAEARPEFIPALGQDERKQFYETANPKPIPNYVIPNLDASGNVQGFTPLPAGSKPAGGVARPPTPQAGMTPGGRQLPPNSILAVNEGKAVARMLPEVETALQQNEALFGPAMGRFGQVNPYDTQAQTVDARMRTASQAFGRFMEGGVLRKEDEEKYRKMFPQLSDTPVVAQNKLSIVRRMLAQKYQSDRQSLGDSGYDVGGLGELEIPPSIFDQSSTGRSNGGLMWQGRPLKDTPANRAWLAAQGGSQ